MTKKIKIFASLVVVVVVFFISGCGENTNYKVDLVMWGAFDDSDAFKEIIAAFREVNPHVGKIDYRKISEQDYRQELIEAMAANKGPDIFLIHNTWLPSFNDKIEPMSERIIGAQEFLQNFVDVAAKDFVIGGKIYALPLSVDSLALYYNKDLFNAAGIVSPPATWEEFDQAVQKLTRIDEFGNITRSGAAMGTAYNINRSTDILGLLMFQNGNAIVDTAKGEVTISNEQGRGALEYFVKFARSNSPVYTWNLKNHYSIDSFYEGTTAMMINYSWHYNTIKNKNAKLNFAVAPVPQPSTGQAVNYANYWGFAVAKGKSAGVTHEAQQFVRFMTVNNNGKINLINGISGKAMEFPLTIDPAKKYLELTNKPAARRDIIESQKNNPVLGPFATGNLIAKSWYQKDPTELEKVLAEAINSINIGSTTVSDALRVATSRIEKITKD